MRVPPARARDIRVAGLVSSILQALASGSDVDRDNVLTNLMPALLAEDPLAATAWVGSLRPEEGREELLRRFAQDWAAIDPAAALSWAEQLPDFDARRSALSDIVTEMAQNNPADAISAAERYQLGSTDPALLPNLAGTWAERDLAAAIGWANLQPPGEQRDQVLARLAMIESKVEPVEAATRVLTDIPPGAVQVEAVMSTLNQWAARDFDSAAAWVAQFPQGSLRDRALAELSGIQAYQMAVESPSPNTSQSLP